MTPQEKKARDLIRRSSNAKLIALWEIADSKKHMTLELSMVRGWLMDEIEARWPDAFWTWVESDEDSPRKFIEI